MSKVDLLEIPSGDGFEFERFVEDLLEAHGWCIVIRAGKGVDGGRDILADCTEVTVTGRKAMRRYVIQCKHTAHGRKSIASADIADLAIVPAKHSASGWLLVTSTKVTADAAGTIAAARSTVPGTDFDFWDSLHLDSLLREPASHSVLKRYFPKSYLALSNVLVPSPEEILSHIDVFLLENPEMFACFGRSPAIDTPEALLALVASKQWSIDALTSLMTDKESINEFLSVWKTNRKRGESKAPLSVLLLGLYATHTARSKGLPETARQILIAGQVGILIQYRSYVRDYWRPFVFARGNPTGWELCSATSKNTYFPPFPLAGVRLLISCSTQGHIAAGALRLRGDCEEIRFHVTFALENQVEIRRPLSEPIEFEFRLEPGSDPIEMAVVGFSEDGHNWNLLV